MLAPSGGRKHCAPTNQYTLTGLGPLGLWRFQWCWRGVKRYFNHLELL